MIYEWIVTASATRFDNILTTHRTLIQFEVEILHKFALTVGVTVLQMRRTHRDTNDTDKMRDFWHVQRTHLMRPDPYRSYGSYGQATN